MFTLDTVSIAFSEYHMKEAPFAILHGGIIEKIKGTIPGTIVLEIQCDYLRKRHPAPGQKFLIALNDCDTIQYDDDDTQTTTQNPKDIESANLEMLSADTSDSTVAIFCTHGTLNLSFRDAVIYLNPQTPITVDALETLARDYWDDWELSTQKTTPSPRTGKFLN